MKGLQFYLLLLTFINFCSEISGNELNKEEDKTISDSINSDLEITDSTIISSSATNSDTSLSTTDSTPTSSISDTNTDSLSYSQDIIDLSTTNSDTSSDTNLDANSDTTSSTSGSTIASTISDTTLNTESQTTTPVIIDLPTKNPIIDLTTDDLSSGNSTQKVKPRIILLGFGLFQRPIRSLVTFKVYFKRFLAKLKSNLLHFTVNVNYLRRLRLLEEQRADCTLISDENNGDMAYNCSVPVDPNKEFTMSANDDFVFGEGEGEEREFIISSYANKTMKILSSQTGDLFENGILTLTDSTVKQDGNIFIIEGNLMEGELNDKQVTLSLDEDGNGNLVNVTCNVNNLGSQKYQLVCSSNKKVKAHLNGVMGKTSSKPLLINMKNDSDDEVDIDSSSMNHIYPKKSSSGLSGGAIAGIIIACLVALIAAAVATFLCNRGYKPALDQTSNNLKLNSSNSVQNIVNI